MNNALAPYDSALGTTIIGDKVMHPGVRWNSKDPITVDMLKTAFDAGRVRGECFSQRKGMEIYDKLTFWQRFRVLVLFLFNKR